MNYKIILFPAILACLILVMLTPSFVINNPTAQADAGDNVRGYAWSENVGWISMNSLDGGGANYGVNVMNNGEIEGYAWSENIGWISFNAADVASCPVGPCTPALDTATMRVTGWARALSPTGGNAANAGGWNGWIRLSDGVNYGITVDSTCKWNGWAWGSDVIGWINFNNGNGGTVAGESGTIACALPDLEVTGASITGTGDMTDGVFDTVTISYQVHNNEGTGPAGASVTTFEYLDGPGGVVLDSETVNEGAIVAGGSSVWHTITLSAVPFNGGKLWARITADSTNIVPESNEGDNIYNDVLTLNLPDPNLQLSIESGLIRYGEKADIVWSLEDHFDMNCTIKGPQLNETFTTDGIPNAADSATVTTGPLTSKGIYVMSCTDAALGTGQVFTTKTEVEVTPRIQEN